MNDNQRRIAQLRMRARRLLGAFFTTAYVDLQKYEAELTRMKQRMREIDKAIRDAWKNDDKPFAAIRKEMDKLLNGINRDIKNEKDPEVKNQLEQIKATKIGTSYYDGPLADYYRKCYDVFRYIVDEL